MTVDLSVVVPTYRRPQLLRRCLTALATSDLEPARFEVVVVDDGSGDHTPRVADEAGRGGLQIRKIVLARNSGPATARNRGVEAAAGEIVLFLDDDVVAPPSLLATHLRLHAGAQDPMQGFLGRVEWEPSLRITPFMRWLDRSGLQFAYDTWLREGPVDPPYAAFYTANLSMPRRLVLDAGGFDERFPYANFEDVELAWRLTERGFRLTYRPEALAYHSRAIDLRAFRARMGREAESAILLRAAQPEFPLEEEGRHAGYLRRRKRIVLALAAPIARLAGREDVLARHYRAQIAVAYLEGRARGQQRLADPAAH